MQLGLFSNAFSQNALSFCSEVLDRPSDLLTESLRRVQRPVGVPKQLPRQQNQVGLAAADYLIGLLRRGDHANGAGHDTGFPPNAFGETHLVPWPHRNLRMGHNAAGGAIYEIDAQVLQPTRQCDRILESPTVVNPIRDGQPHE